MHEADRSSRYRRDASRRGRIIWGHPLVIALAAAVVLYCDDRYPLAPDGSHIDLAIAPSQIAVDGDTAVIGALVTEVDGRIVDDKTTVTFVATGGMLCPRDGSGGEANCGTGSVPGVATAKTAHGVASVFFISGGTGSTATITARSGSAQATGNLVLTSSAAPSGTKVTLEVRPDTIAVGARATILAYLSAPDGTPVPDGTRVVFAASDSSLEHALGVTRDGFVSTTAVGKAAGPVSVSIASGPAQGHVTLVVR